MEDKTKEINDLSKIIRQEIKETKSQFINIINYINTNKIKLDLSLQINMIELIKLWRNNKNANIDYYFNMKNYHTYITGKFINNELSNMWDQYLLDCLEFRVKLLNLNHLLQNI